MILEYCLAKRKFSTRQKRNIKKPRMIKFSVWLGTSLIRKKAAIYIGKSNRNIVKVRKTEF